MIFSGRESWWRALRLGKKALWASPCHIGEIQFLVPLRKGQEKRLTKKTEAYTVFKNP